MKTPLQTTLAHIAPALTIATIWSHDLDIDPDIRKDCDGFEDEDPNDWQAWQSEISVSAIHGGDLLTGSAYLGATWEKYCDHPSESNPDISGYEPGMTREALEDLAKQLPDDSRAHDDIRAALAHLATPATV